MILFLDTKGAFYSVALHFVSQLLHTPEEPNDLLHDINIFGPLFPALHLAMSGAPMFGR